MIDWGKNGCGPASEGLVRVTIKNQLPEIATVTGAMEDFARSRDLPEAIRWRFHLALEELLRNVISHAYPDKAEHAIEVTLDCDDTHMTAAITDDGIPFNPLNIAAPELSEALEERVVGGLGIHLARNVVDTLTYEWRDSRNVVTLVSELGVPQ